MNLANKYRPHTWEDMTEQKLIVDILKNMCEAETLNNRNFLLTGPAGCGKAQPLTSKVLTTNRGFIKMGDIKVGDTIYTHTGAIASVQSIHPQGVRDIYQIVLEDDTVIEVSDEHNNLIEFVIHTSIGDADYVQDVISTKTLFNLFESQKEFECYIPSPLNCDKYNIEHLSSAELDMFAHRAFKDRWRIKSVTFNRQEDCQCIYVAHSDHTYISDNFIVTHNTTLGRIMADVINSGVGDPIEIDAASHNGVDSMREIVSQAQIYPIGTKYKVFILDECHSLSNGSWQILLKTLEDGPAKSLFVLCTTDPERIPATILSRVQVFQLSKISLDGIHKRLIHVLDSEIAEGQQLTYDDAAVNLIAKLANGGMRNALTLLDKVLAYSSDVTSKNVVDALDLPNYSDFFDLLSAYAKKDNAAISSIITKVYNSGINFHKWFEAFHAFVIQIVIYIYQQDIGATTIPEYFSEKIAPYTTAHAVVCLKLANTLVKLNYEMKSTQYQKELALTHLLFAKT